VTLTGVIHNKSKVALERPHPVFIYTDRNTAFPMVHAFQYFDEESKSLVPGAAYSYSRGVGAERAAATTLPPSRSGRPCCTAAGARCSPKRFPG